MQSNECGVLTPEGNILRPIPKSRLFQQAL
jgi:hypothetical protein